MLYCHYGKQAQLRISWTNDNPGRRFHGCQNWKRGGCDYFVWEDPPMCSRAMTIIPGLRRKIVGLKDEVQELTIKNKKLKFFLLVS
ncbi:hypothetical protein Pfo_024461 [Paulownia fortunei]|nr:hypothetical protein Pfo_024461 [Paulownia fortunei]